MATPNFIPGRGGLATNRYDFQSHIEGTAFRHNSNQIDVSPPVDVNGTFYHTVADALTAVSALTSVANTLIFSPNGVANSNVYTSWTALMTARALIQGPATIVVNSTESSPATIDVGTWDLTQNTSIVGNVYGPLETYCSTLIIPDGAKLLNPVLFKNLSLGSSSNSPAIDFSSPFVTYVVEFNNTVIITTGSGAILNGKSGSIMLNGLTAVFATLVQGTVAGSMNFYLDGESRVSDNAVNISGGTATIFVNNPSVFCGTTQPGATINGLGSQSAASDVLGQPGNNYVGSLTGDGSDPIVINVSNLQWVAAPSAGSPITFPSGAVGVGFTQLESVSTAANTIGIIGQPGFPTFNGGNIEISGGSASGGGVEGSVIIETFDTQNKVVVSSTGIAISAGNASQISVSGTTITIGKGGANTNTIFQVGGTTNLSLTSSQLQWATGITNPILNQASTSSGNGTNFTISAQSTSAGSSTGGNLIVSGGTGTSSNGYVKVSGAKKYYQFAGTGSAAKNISNYLATYDSSGTAPQLAYTIPALSNGQVATVEVVYVGNDSVSPGSSSSGKIAGLFFCGSGSATQVGTTKTVYFVGNTGTVNFAVSSNTIQLSITPPLSDATFWQLDIYVGIA